MKVIEGGFPAPNAKIAIVISRFNSFINESLLSGAIASILLSVTVRSVMTTLPLCVVPVRLSCLW